MKKSKVDKMIEQYLDTLPKWVKMYSELENKIRRRCLLEGCVFGYELIDKEPKDNCIYCGEPREYVFGIPEIRKSRKKLGIKYLFPHPKKGEGGEGCKHEKYIGGVCVKCDYVAFSDLDPKKEEVGG